MFIRLEVPENNDKAVSMMSSYAASLATNIQLGSEIGNVRTAMATPYKTAEKEVRKTVTDYAKIMWRQYLKDFLKGKDPETKKAIRAEVKMKFKVCNQIPDIDKRPTNVAYVLYDPNGLIYKA